MASKPTIQRGQITIGAASSVNVVRGTSAGFDTTVDTSKTILLFSHSHGTDGSGEVNKLVRGRLIDGNTITFDRGGTSGTVTIEWQLLSFASGVTVEHFAGTIATTTTQTTFTTASPGSGGRFIIANGVAPSTFGFDQTLTGVEWDFNGSTTLRARCNTSSATITLNIAAQVVEWDVATVQTVTWAAQSYSTNTTFDKTITSVDAAKTLLFGSVRSTSGAYGNVAMGMSLTSSTNLRLTRTPTTSGITFNATVFVVSLASGLAVQRVTPTMAASTTQVDTTITAVVTADTALLTGAVFSGFSAARNNSTNFARIAGRYTLTSTTNVRVDRGSGTTDGVDYNVQIAEFSVTAPTISGQPVAATNVLTNDNTASFSVTASGTPPLTYQWQLEDSVGSGTYTNVANGSGLTFSGNTSDTLTVTIANKTASGRRVRCRVTDSNGTTDSNAVALTIFDGPQLTAFAPTDGSGVTTATLTCDYVTGTGEAIEVAVILPDGRLAVSTVVT